MREEEMREIKNTELNTHIHSDTRQQTLGGILFPMTESATQAIADAKRGAYNYLQFSIEQQEEQIHLVKAAHIELDKLPSQVPNDHARYHLFLFKHTHEGDYMENFVFIYSMPGYNCSVKERMMYSSCKGLFVKSIESLGVEITKKVTHIFLIPYYYYIGFYNKNVLAK